MSRPPTSHHHMNSHMNALRNREFPVAFQAHHISLLSPTQHDRRQDTDTQFTIHFHVCTKMF
jgi:hypothetical protein